MRHQEFYRRYKTNYPPVISPWNFVVIMVIGALLEPMLIYKNFRHMQFTFHYYLHQVEYFSLIAVPLTLFIFWANWREARKRRLGYCWVGKFEVIGKHTSLAICYLNLAPGAGNSLKVDRNLFRKTQVGDYVIVRRDSLGEVDEVRRVNNFLGRVTRTRMSMANKTG